MLNKKAFQKLIVWVLLVSLSACTAGSTVNLKADKLQKPVSMTSYIHDSNLKVQNEYSYTTQGSFLIELDRSGHFWNMYNPKKDTDLSEQLNQKMQEANADGIVNLKVEASGGAGAIMNTGIHIFGGFIGLILLFSGDPVSTVVGAGIFAGSQYLPGKVHIKVQGDLIKYK